MTSERFPPELVHLSEWEAYERDFRKADLAGNIEQMTSIWRQAFVFWYQARIEVPPDLSPLRYIQDTVQEGTGTYTKDVGTWLTAMAKWSRKKTSTRYRR